MCVSICMCKSVWVCCHVLVWRQSFTNNYYKVKENLNMCQASEKRDI